VQCWPLEEQESALSAWNKQERACGIFVGGIVMGEKALMLIWEQATLQVLMVACVQSFQFHNFTDPTDSERSIHVHRECAVTRQWAGETCVLTRQ